MLVSSPDMHDMFVARSSARLNLLLDILDNAGPPTWPARSIELAVQPLVWSLDLVQSAATPMVQLDGRSCPMWQGLGPSSHECLQA